MELAQGTGAIQAVAANSLSRDFVVGVTSGVVTTVLLWLLGFAWKDVFQPWFEARVYRGLDVAGTWELENPIDPKTAAQTFHDNEVVALLQAAHRLHGSLTFASPVAPTQAVAQDLSGEIRDRLVCFTTRARSRKSVGYTCVLAEVSPDGQRMNGHAIFYDLSLSRVDSSAVTYVRRA